MNRGLIGTIIGVLVVIILVIVILQLTWFTIGSNGGVNDNGDYVHNILWNAFGYPGTKGITQVKTYPNVHKHYSGLTISSFAKLTSIFAAISGCAVVGRGGGCRRTRSGHIDVRMPPDLTDDGARAARAVRAKHPKLGIVL